jgi:hypothetical protein
VKTAALLVTNKPICHDGRILYPIRRSRFLETHPSLEKSEGWGTLAVRVIQGCATRRHPAENKMQIPFDYAQGSLSTPLRFAQNDVARKIVQLEAVRDFLKNVCFFRARI